MRWVPNIIINFHSIKEKKNKELEWTLTHDNCVIKAAGKLFAPGNLRASSEHEKYRDVINTWID